MLMFISQLQNKYEINGNTPVIFNRSLTWYLAASGTEIISLPLKKSANTTDPFLGHSFLTFLPMKSEILSAVPQGFLFCHPLLVWPPY